MRGGLAANRGEAVAFACYSPRGDADSMKKHVREAQRRRRKPSALATTLKWMVIVAVAGLIVYGLAQFSGVAWDEEDIRVVDFSTLSPGAKRTALRRANSARCTCGCGMNMAQCVATDSTCPIREKNIEAIRTMVREVSGI